MSRYQIPDFKPAAAALPAGNDREWFDRIANCAHSCAVTMEARRLKSNEVPIVLGSLAVAVADHTGMPLESVLRMIATAARGLVKATPEAPAPFPS